MLSIMEIYLLILLLSVVQSLFGVGILLFGTPLLLLLGYEYTEALLYLLPASAALSWSQVKDTRHEKLDGGYRKLFFLLCIPLMVSGMLLSKNLNFQSEIKLFVIIMLLIAFFLRTSQQLRDAFQKITRKHLKLSLSIMGIVHGLSNMGGSILTPLASSLYVDKKKVLAAVSFDYAFMASIQLFVLLALNGERFESKFLAGAAISLLVRYTIGKKTFASTSESHYQYLLNGLILANAVLLGLNL